MPSGEEIVERMVQLYNGDKPDDDPLSVKETVVRLIYKKTGYIFVNGRKVCGILTEASLDCESGRINYLIVGIGINTHVPETDYPEELKGVAGPAFGTEQIPELRCRLAAAVLDRLTGYYETLLEKDWFEEYKRRSLVLGKPVMILSAGREAEPATALDIDRDFALIVRTETDGIRRLNSGEVSIRQK